MPVVYAVNTKVKGKTHLVTPETARLARDRQRVRCGWRITRATSMVYYSSRLKWATFCRKCFPYSAAAPKSEDKDIVEDVEQFAEEEHAPE